MEPYKCAGTVFVFKNGFDKILTKELLDVIKHYEELILSNQFNKKIKNLPKSILILSTGCLFNNYLDNLHSLLTKLELKVKFNKNIYFLPNSLIDLKFGIEFNKKIDGLPNSILYLRTSSKYNREKTKFSNKLRSLIIPNPILAKRYKKLTDSLYEKYNKK